VVGCVISECDLGGLRNCCVLCMRVVSVVHHPVHQLCTSYAPRVFWVCFGCEWRFGCLGVLGVLGVSLGNVFWGDYAIFVCCACALFLWCTIRCTSSAITSRRPR
jgi:hypothetical protein